MRWCSITPEATRGQDAIMFNLKVIGFMKREAERLIEVWIEDAPGTDATESTASVCQTRYNTTPCRRRRSSVGTRAVNYTIQLYLSECGS